jgi:hypothetical protein
MSARDMPEILMWRVVAPRTKAGNPDECERSIADLRRVSERMLTMDDHLGITSVAALLQKPGEAKEFHEVGCFKPGQFPDVGSSQS